MMRPEGQTDKRYQYVSIEMILFKQNRAEGEKKEIKADKETWRTRKEERKNESLLKMTLAMLSDGRGPPATYCICAQKSTRTYNKNTMTGNFLKLLTKI